MTNESSIKIKTDKLSDGPVCRQFFFLFRKNTQKKEDENQNLKCFDWKKYFQIWLIGQNVMA